MNCDCKLGNYQNTVSVKQLFKQFCKMMIVKHMWLEFGVCDIDVMSTTRFTPYLLIDLLLDLLHNKP